MNRTRRLPVMPLLLTLCFVLIWLQDTGWSQSLSDTLPVLAALPLFYWLGRPWNLAAEPSPPSAPFLVTGIALFALGVITGIALFPALGWTAFLWSWLSPRLATEARARVSKLLPLPVMAFPWLLLDGRPVGWWFRLTGAEATEGVFTLLRLDVLRQGTRLLVENLPVDVAPACSGLNTLQAMLIAGIALAFLELGETRLYWVCLPLLAAAAWMANTLRIIAITSTALVFDPETAMGIFHTLGGWMVLVVMFLLCLGAFRLMAPHAPTDTGPGTQ
ncbi:exosortase/archaeosortase family protein [Desulfoluna spongiiphila]|uniref:Exosortase n=1 Tax=Desulfoluna spongiiphila TaxID=419481 RepID=A0A1G5ET73_9BACT|nr:exosortase/archaeosortase family protein [Desulfoluna spongiiphila]SCY30157.1 exosortase [Desulfoluna spongiiphila]